MNFKTILLASAVALAAPAAAFAGDTAVSYNVGVTSDYIWRGVSQSDEGPAVFAGADLSAGTLYAGIWASSVDFGHSAFFFDTGADVEVDIYAGWKPSLGPVTFDLGVLAYNYPGATANAFVEYKAGAAVTLGKVSLSLSDYYSTDFSNYVELGVSAPLGDLKVGPFALAAAASFGTQTSEPAAGALEYDNYKVAVSGTTESGIVLEVGFTDTDVKKSDFGTYDYKFVDPSAYLTLKKTF